MANKVRIELNSSGIQAFLRGPEVSEMVKSYAEEVRSRAGDGYAVRMRDTGQRAAANVYPETEEAWQDNMENNTLLRGISS